jgi:hypothetical protein
MRSKMSLMNEFMTCIVVLELPHIWADWIPHPKGLRLAELGLASMNSTESTLKSS